MPAIHDVLSGLMQMTNKRLTMRLAHHTALTELVLLHFAYGVHVDTTQEFQTNHSFGVDQLLQLSGPHMAKTTVPEIERAHLFLAREITLISFLVLKVLHRVHLHHIRSLLTPYE